LQRRRESDPLNAFLSESKDTWRSLLQHAEDHTVVKPARHWWEVNPVSSVREVEESVKCVTDNDAAAMYQEEFFKYIVYRAIKGVRAHQSEQSFKNDSWFNMILFEGQVMTFLGRKQGSIKNVLYEIRRSTTDRMEQYPDYPRIPADFFVAAIELIAKENSKDSSYFAGIPRIPLLIEAIMETPDY
jgi:hypothetical protein